MKKDPINIFGHWALSGRDERMAGQVYLMLTEAGTPNV